MVHYTKSYRLYHRPTDPHQEKDVGGSFPIAATYLQTRLWEHSPSFRRSAVELLPLEHDSSDPSVSA